MSFSNTSLKSHLAADDVVNIQTPTRNDKYLEHYVSKEQDFYDESENYVIAKKLAQLVIENFINNIDEVWGTEVSVLYKNIYAGSTL